MHMGMNRRWQPLVQLDTRVPHAHGDEPVSIDGDRVGRARSPCTWG